MKNKFSKEQPTIAIHTSSGFYLFSLNSYENPGFLSVSK